VHRNRTSQVENGPGERRYSYAVDRGDIVRVEGSYMHVHDTASLAAGRPRPSDVDALDSLRADRQSVQNRRGTVADDRARPELRDCGQDKSVMAFLVSGLWADRRAVRSATHPLQLIRAKHPLEVVRRKATLGQLPRQEEITHILTLRTSMPIVPLVRSFCG
jgi:hypothetical protein